MSEKPVKLLYLHHRDLLEQVANVIQVLHMCYAFSKHGAEVVLLVPRKRSVSMDNVMEVAEAKLGRKPNFEIQTYHPTTIFGRGKALVGVRGMKKHIARFDSDWICFARSQQVNFLALSMGRKTIFESHATLLHSNKRLNEYFTQKLIKSSHDPNQLLFVSISQALTDHWIAQGVPAAKSISFHDAVSAEDFEQVQPDPKVAKEKLGWDTSKKHVVYAGSLYADRGIEQILEMADRYPDAEFMVLGGPAAQQTHYEQVAAERKLTNLHFLGRVPHHQVKGFLEAGDVLLMLWSWSVPTIHICSPLKVFEYMATARVVLGQKFPTIIEVVEDGRNALLADPDDFEELYAKLGEALTYNYPNALADAARKRVLEHYTWEARTGFILQAFSH